MKTSRSLARLPHACAFCAFSEAALVAAALTACSESMYAPALSVNDPDTCRNLHGKPWVDTMLRYNEVAQIGTHNSYETIWDGYANRIESLFDQLAYHQVRSLELDIHDRSPDYSEIPIEDDQDFYVYHDGYRDPAGLIDHTRAPSCRTLAGCLRQLRRFDESEPYHEVVTVWIEQKEDWTDGHQPADFDAEVARAIGRRSLFTPADLIDSCNGQRKRLGSPPVHDLVAAVEKCGWPRLERLRGKVIFVMMQTDTGDDNASLASVLTYAGGDPLARVAFLAPDPSFVAARPGPAEATAHSNSIFSNINDTAQSAVSQFESPFDGRLPWRRYVFRKALGSRGEAEDALRRGVQVPAAEFPEDVGVTGAHGWPFAMVAPGAPAGYVIDDQTVVHLRAQSSADSYAFWPAVENPEMSSEWSCYVAGAGTSSLRDSVDEPAKGCLMARANESLGAPYFAICRPESGSAFVEYRSTANAPPTKVSLPYDVLGEAVYLSLVAAQSDERLWCYTGYAGVVATTQCFGDRLALQGLAVSSGTDETTKFLFGDLFRADAKNGRSRLTAEAFGAASGIGQVTQLSAGDGKF
jgi:hypothetical protein